MSDLSKLSEEREATEDARRERIRIEIYRAALAIYVTRSEDGCSFEDAIKDAIGLWEALNLVSVTERPY